MWKRKLALILGVIGGAASALAPLANGQTDSHPYLAADVIGGAVIGGAIWAAIGLGIGALIDASKRRSGKSVVPAFQSQPMPTVGVPEWLPDPSRRFWYRFWNGERWTDEVSSAGRTYTDEPTL